MCDVSANQIMILSWAIQNRESSQELQEYLENKNKALMN